MNYKETFKQRALIIDLDNKSLTQEEKQLLRHPFVAGVLLLERNYESIKQIKELIHEIKALNKPHLLVLTDHEGGPVQRFRQNFLPIPSLFTIGEYYNCSPTKSLLFAEQVAWAAGIELSTIGVDINLSPVVDLQYKKSIYKKRTIHYQKEIVTKLATSLINGMSDAGVRSVIKHYPGHGATSVDSHYALPEDYRSLDEVRGNDLYPFAKLIEKNIVEGVMTAHFVYKKVNDELVTYSKFWLNQILKKELSFKGIIFSDDLSMEAARIIASPFERIQMALNSGCDYVIMTHDRSSIQEVLQQIKPSWVTEDINYLLYNKQKTSEKDLLSIKFKRISEKINNFNF